MAFEFLPVVLADVGITTDEWGRFFRGVGASIVFTCIGLVFFALTFWVICKVCPFSVRKEIEEDQNTSLAIVIGSVLIGIAIIIAAAVHG